MNQPLTNPLELLKLAGLKPQPLPRELTPQELADLDRFRATNLRDSEVKLPDQLRSLDPDGPPMLEQLEEFADQSQAGQEALSKLYRSPAIRQTLMLG